MCRVSARRLSIYNFAWGLLKASNLKSGKRPNIYQDGICRPDPKP
jgi:hypothetical protein